MYAMNPWGEHGANPLPGFCARLAQQMGQSVVGGWPYSEGIYEDLNKFIWARYYWNPQQTTDDTLREYAAYYLSPTVAEDAVALFHLLEQAHPRNGWSVQSLQQAPQAFELAQRIDAAIPAFAKQSWRWRLIYSRAAIDALLQQGQLRTPEGQKKLQALCDEIRAIYHATDTFIAPPGLPALPDPRNIALGKLPVVSSTHPEVGDSARRLTDGALAQDDPQSFWAHDPKEGDSATITLDLGDLLPLDDVRLQFREIYGVYWFLPSRVAVEVSDDGEHWAEAHVTEDLPKEGAVCSPDLLVCPLGRQARFVRVGLSGSQHKGDRWEGLLELT